jgi:hypothetical protein
MEHKSRGGEPYGRPRPRWARGSAAWRPDSIRRVLAHQEEKPPLGADKGFIKDAGSNESIIR